MFISFMDTFNKINGAVNSVVWGPPILLLIIATGIYLTVRLGFFQVVHAKLVTKNTVGEMFEKKPETQSKNALSPFQALSTALAATVGTGNIVGVTTAVVSGGPGAVFWMWLSAFFGMMTKFSEIVLGMYYRKRNSDGEYSGGTMYFLEEGLKNKKGRGFLAKPLAVIFAFFCMFASFGIGNMSQVNSISESMLSGFNVPLIISGVAIAVITALVILGGLKRIGSFCEKLVPFMSIFYVGCSLVIIVMNYKMLPHAFAGIFQNAFRFEAVAGAAVGLLFKNAVTWGLKRGIFSNEAGLGSSVLAHASSAEKEPVKQAMWGIFEVFADTIIICTMTALIILTTSFNVNKANIPAMSLEEMKAAASVSEQVAILKDSSTGEDIELVENSPFEVSLEDGENLTSFSRVMKYGKDSDGNFKIEQLNGAALMTIAFQNTLGEWSAKILSVAIMLFALSTVIGWSVYGLTATNYLFKNKVVSLIYKLLFIAAIVVGSVTKLDVVWDLSDTLNGLMAVPNLIGVLLLSPTVLKITRNYVDRKIKGKNESAMLSAYDN